MPTVPHIETRVARAHWPELDQLVAERSVTVDDLHDWFRSHGYTFSRTAVGNWRKRHRALLADPTEQLRRYIRGRIGGMNFAQLDAVCRQVNAIPL